MDGLGGDMSKSPAEEYLSGFFAACQSLIWF
jgi:hypothetical protein